MNCPDCDKDPCECTFDLRHLIPAAPGTFNDRVRSLRDAGLAHSTPAAPVGDDAERERKIRKQVAKELEMFQRVGTIATAPVPAFSVLREWMGKARGNCTRQGRKDAAALWGDALAHLDSQAARIAELERRPILQHYSDAVARIAELEAEQQNSHEAWVALSDSHRDKCAELADALRQLAAAQACIVAADAVRDQYLAMWREVERNTTTPIRIVAYDAARRAFDEATK